MTKTNRANVRGQMMENFISSSLDDYEKIDVRRGKSNLFFDSSNRTHPTYATQCPAGESIYGKTRRVDFILHHPVKWPEYLVIQCKWQGTSGSVDEKYPYEVLSIEANDYPTIIVLDGKGYSPAAAEWLKAQAGKDKKLIHVMTMAEIINFHHKGKL